jgi:nucleotide-binding universal stress UspA family protein
MQPILVASDGSPSANRAIDAAAKLAKVTGSELIILTIGGNISGAALQELASAEGDLSAALETAANEILDRARKRVLRTGVSAVKVQSGWGDPAEVIIDTVRRENPDLLVVGKRGRGRLSGLLLGSVSQKLASLAPCKVMVVP